MKWLVWLTPPDTPLGSEQETEGTVHTNSAALDDNRMAKTLPGPMSLKFRCDFQMAGSEFGVNNMKVQICCAFY